MWVTVPDHGHKCGSRYQVTAIIAYCYYYWPVLNNPEYQATALTSQVLLYTMLEGVQYTYLK